MNIILGLMFVIIVTVLLVSFVFTTVSFFSNLKTKDITIVIDIRKKYGIIKNPVDAAWLFYNKKYPDLGFKYFEILDVPLYFAPVFIGQFIWSDLPPKISLSEKLKKKYPL